MSIIKKYFELIFFIVAILLVLIGGIVIYLAYSGSEIITTDSQPYEVRYQSPFVAEAWLVWGIDGSEIAPAESQPEGTVIKDGMMHSPMIFRGDHHVVPIDLPDGTIIRYGFLITYQNDQSTVEMFEPNEFDHVVRKDTFTRTIAGTFPDGFFQAGEGVTTQRIEYAYPQDASIDMVWGINDWQIADEALWPAGTRVEDGVLVTPLVRNGDRFSIDLQIPAGTLLDYQFIITTPQGVILEENNLEDTYFNTRVNLNYPIKISPSPSVEKFLTPETANNASWLILNSVFSLLLLGLGVALARRPQPWFQFANRPLHLPYPVLSFKKFKRLAYALFAINIGILIGGWLFQRFSRTYLGDWALMPPSKFLFVQLDLAAENVIVNWYSALLMFFVGIAALYCHQFDKDAFHLNVFFKQGWLVLALCFFGLSLDEIGSLHERLANLQSGSWSWVAVLAMPIILVGGYLFGFAWFRIRKSRNAFIFFVIGLALYLSLPFHALVEAEFISLFGEENLWQRPIRHLLFEEGSKLFGTLSFLLSFILFGYQLSRQNRPLGTVSTIRLEGNRFTGFIIATLGAAGLLMVIIEYLLPRFILGDSGVPSNWFPAMITFTAAYIAFQLRFRATSKQASAQTLYSISIATSLLLSIFWGSDWPNWLSQIAETGIDYTFALSTIVLVLLTFLTLAWLVYLDDWLPKLLAVASLILWGWLFQSGQPLSSTAPFAMSVVYLLSILSHLIHWRPRHSRKVRKTAADDVQTPEWETQIISG